MISLSDFYMGRDVTHAAELTPAIEMDATETVRRVNLLLAAMAADGVTPGVDLATKTAVASGWRPALVNASTPNAAKASKHMLGQACDIRDTPDRELCRWALAHQEVLMELSLWCERPQWTPTWLHCQILPPNSGHRFFIPSTAPPPAQPLPGESA